MKEIYEGRTVIVTSYESGIKFCGLLHERLHPERGLYVEINAPTGLRLFGPLDLKDRIEYAKFA